MLSPLEPACGCRDGLGHAAKTLRSELVAERALARGMDPEERPDQAAPPGLTMRSPSRAQPHTARPGISLSKLQKSKSTKARKPPRRPNMKLMKTMIALLLSATGTAALPIPKTVALSIARTAAKHSAAAAAGGPKKAFALDQIVVPLKQDDALPATIAVGEIRPDLPGFLAESKHDVYNQATPYTNRSVQAHQVGL